MNAESVVGSKPLVSVIIPMYNAALFIEETVQSVINQDYDHWELLIVDDCSTDRSNFIVRNLCAIEPRIKLIESKLNFGGPAKPRNIGMKHASGEYIAFLDADDVWLPSKLSTQVKFMEDFKEIDICHSLAFAINADGDIIGTHRNQRIYKSIKSFTPLRHLIFYTCYININTVLMRSSKEVRFDEDKFLIAVEDWKFWIDNLLLGKTITLINSKLIKYRVLNDSISKRSSTKGYKKAIYMLSKLYLDELIPATVFIRAIILNVFRIIRKTYRNRVVVKND